MDFRTKEPPISKSEIFQRAAVQCALGSSDFDELAQLVALNAHWGQKRHSGKRHSVHVEEVVKGKPCSNPAIQRPTRWLHDVIEDSNWTEGELRQIFPKEIIDGVVLLTKEKGQPYYDFIVAIGKGTKEDIKNRLRIGNEQAGNKLHVENKLSDTGSNKTDCDADHELTYKLSEQYLADILYDVIVGGTEIGRWVLAHADTPENWASFDLHSSEGRPESRKPAHHSVTAQVAIPV